MKKKVIFVYLILIIVLSISVQAVGLSSFGSILKETDFLPGQQVTYSYMLRTTVDFTQNYQLSAEGDLAHLITFAPDEILEDIAPGQDPWFNVIINFPGSEGNLTPGIHGVRIGVLEGSDNSGGAGVGGRTGVTTRIMIRILNPGKFLKASLDAPDVNINEPVRMDINLENWGKQTINSAQAYLTVSTQEGEFKDSIQSDSVAIASAKEATAYAVLDTLGYPPGDYYVEGYVLWDGEKTLVNDTFRIGTQDIKINSYTSTFEQNRISPFILNIESIWNSPTSNVYFIVDLPNVKIQSPTYILGSWENKNLTAYWDTHGVPLGEYDAAINLYYNSNVKTKKVKVSVFDKVEVQEQKPLGFFNYAYLILIILVLIIINVLLWFFVLRKKNKNKEVYQPPL